MTDVMLYGPFEVMEYQQWTPEDMQAKALFVWGQSGDNQLVTEPNDEGNITEPSKVAFFDGYKVHCVALGTKHSLFLTSSGLYSTGCNQYGQLGCYDSEKIPVLVKSLEAIKLVAVAVGENHSLALSEEGIVYSWGDNQFGQLGRVNKTYQEPRPVQFPNKTCITKIACGDNHCLALSKDGALYTWGCNSNGQLGHGSPGSFLEKPQAISSIRSIYFTKIATGGNHSFALTISGAIFGWGCNGNGQLGIGHNEDKAFPVCCRNLRQQKIKHICCGQNHSVALTEDGGVFTFGAGNHGQLGHNLANDEFMPKKVIELMGSAVTQVVAGRYHTLAYVPASGRIYAFGLGAYGQLGINDVAKKLVPGFINGPWNGNGQLHKQHIKFIAAGGNCSAAYLEEKAYPILDQRTIPNDQYVVDKRLFDVIIASNDNSQHLTASQEALVSAIFSCVSIWNGAYLLKESHYGCSSTNHGLDLDRAREELSNIPDSNNQFLSQLIVGNMEKHLLPGLGSQVPDVESLRAFLLIPFIPVFTNPACYPTIHGCYGQAFLNLDKTPMKVIGNWLVNAPRRHFKYYLATFKKVVAYIINQDKPSTEYESLRQLRVLEICLKFMEKFNEINDSSGEQLVSCTDFYISEIVDRVDIKTDYCSWYTKHYSGQNGLYFCNYPFIFDAKAKSILLNTDAVIQMQQAIEQAHRLNLINILSSAQIDPVHPCLVISVSRDNIVQDTMLSLAKHGGADLKKPLKVQFLNEAGVDEGGVKKEFFMLLIREILDLKYGMFRYFEESRLLWFNSTSFEEFDMYHLIGLICGLAIYNTTIVDLPFPLALYKKLLRKKVNLDDMRELDPAMGKSLQDLLDYDADDLSDVFCLTFSVNVEVYGVIQVVDLIPNGSEVIVTNENRQDYVEKYVDYIFNSSVSKMFEAFSNGFHRVCGSRILEFFHPIELQAMIVGNQDYDWSELEKNCEYKGEFYKFHKTIQMFWEVFFELPHEQKKQFLLYLTGSDRIPIYGMKSLKIIIQPVRVSEEYLPVAHTCFNLLDLPIQYSSKEKLKKKLLLAIENTQGFGLA